MRSMNSYNDPLPAFEPTLPVTSRLGLTFKLTRREVVLAEIIRKEKSDAIRDKRCKLEAEWAFEKLKHDLEEQKPAEPETPQNPKAESVQVTKAELKDMCQRVVAASANPQIMRELIRAQLGKYNRVRTLSALDTAHYVDFKVWLAANLRVRGVIP